MRPARLLPLCALIGLGCNGGGSDTPSGTETGTDASTSSGSSTTTASGTTGPTSGTSGSTTGSATGPTSATAGTDATSTGTSSATDSAGSTTGSTGSATTGGAACYPDDTASPTPADFSAIRLPFFRGQICTVDKVPPGVDIPMTFKPCIHPCITEGAFHFKRYDNCVNGACEGWTILWFDNTSGTSCPTDAFGRFDKGQCVYDTVVNSGFKAQTEGGQDVTKGTLTAVIPYMSNDDVVEVDEHMGTVGELLDLVDGKMAACPRTDDRIFTFDIDAAHPAPPVDCQDEPGCTCREVGFLP